MDAVILGKKYPMAYTVAAQSVIAKRFGGIEKIEQAFRADDIAGFMDNMTFCASAMIKGHADRETVRAITKGDKAQEFPVLTPEQIAAAILPGEVKPLASAVMAALKEGNKVEVEVSPKKGKNAEATQSE